MVALWIIIILLCLLTAVGTLIALRIQHRMLHTARQEREAWQQAQEGRQRTWEVRQGKHILEAEKKLADQLKEARREWRQWSVQLQQEHQEWREEVDLEKELARLPHVEEVGLGHTQLRERPKDWHPAALYQADLRGRDLSYRYLERADLREAQLTDVSLYMADLSGATLTAANLSGADLTGANLSGADLRGANLCGVNLLVADLHNAILHGADLTGARNLDQEHLQSAIYDSTTLIDSAIDVTLPRIPGVVTTPPALLVPATPESEVAEPAPAPVADESSAPAAASSAPLANSTDPAPVLESSSESASAHMPTTSDEQESVPSADEADQELSPSTETALPAQEVAPVAKEAGKRNGANRKRPAKARSARPLTPTFAGKPEDGRATSDDFDEEAVLSNKIIPLQKHTSKTRPLPVAGEQNRDEQPAQNAFFERSS